MLLHQDNLRYYAEMAQTSYMVHNFLFLIWRIFLAARHLRCLRCILIFYSLRILLVLLRPNCANRVYVAHFISLLLSCNSCVASKCCKMRCKTESNLCSSAICATPRPFELSSQGAYNVQILGNETLIIAHCEYTIIFRVALWDIKLWLKDDSILYQF